MPDIVKYNNNIKEFKTGFYDLWNIYTTSCYFGSVINLKVANCLRC
jgi:hypothetical protein